MDVQTTINSLIECFDRISFESFDACVKCVRQLLGGLRSTDSGGIKSALVMILKIKGTNGGADCIN